MVEETVQASIVHKYENNMPDYSEPQRMFPIPMTSAVT